MASSVQQQLHRAITKGDVALSRELLRTDPHGLLSAKVYGQTALHVAAANNQLDIVALLLENAADPDRCNSNNETALHIAAAEGYSDIAHLLLVHKASVECEDHQCTHPIHAAAIMGHHEVIRVLLSHGADANVEYVAQESPMWHSLTLSHTLVH